MSDYNEGGQKMLKIPIKAAWEGDISLIFGLLPRLLLMVRAHKRRAVSLRYGRLEGQLLGKKGGAVLMGLL